jgi:hypothetical protein
MLPDRRASLGYDEPGYTKAVALNDLDDWAGMHASLTRA